MPYYIDDVYQPYTQDDDQDMWVGEITFIPDDPDDMRHEACIEVRGDDENLLIKRMNVIINALNRERKVSITIGD